MREDVAGDTQMESPEPHGQQEHQVDGTDPAHATSQPLGTYS